MIALIVIVSLLLAASIGINLIGRFSMPGIRGRNAWQSTCSMISSHAWYHGYFEDQCWWFFLLPGKLVVMAINFYTDRKNEWYPSSAGCLYPKSWWIRQYGEHWKSWVWGSRRERDDDN